MGAWVGQDLSGERQRGESTLILCDTETNVLTSRIKHFAFFMLAYWFYEYFILTVSYVYEAAYTFSFSDVIWIDYWIEY